MSSLLVSLVLVLGFLAPATAHAASSLLVDDDKVECPDADTTTIQAAVDLANPGDVIKVCDGSYAGGIVMNKAGLTLKPAKRKMLPKIVGTGATGPKNGITIIADNVRVTGFEISGFNNQVEASGIFVGGNNVGDTAHPADFADISDNNIHDNGYGIYLWQSNNNRIEGNEVHHGIALQNDGGNGIFAFVGTGDTQINAANTAGRSGLNNRITQNIVHNNPRRGIFVGACTNGCTTGATAFANIAGTKIDKNTVSGHGSLNLAEGIGVLDVQGGLITKNEVMNNLRHGILINWGSGTIVSSNLIHDNATDASTFSGIRINQSTGILVKSNESFGNGRGIKATTSTNLIFKGNEATGNIGTDLDIDDGSIATSNFSRNKCGTATPSKEVWDCKS